MKITEADDPERGCWKPGISSGKFPEDPDECPVEGFISGRQMANPHSSAAAGVKAAHERGGAAAGSTQPENYFVTLH